MDNLPMSSMGEGQRQGQYLADVARENGGPATRERFSDNLTTLMFMVASDLCENKFPFPVRNVYPHLHFCNCENSVRRIVLHDPKSSMENPSLRVSGHVSSMNRTSIAEDFAEDEFGQWAKDESDWRARLR